MRAFINGSILTVIALLAIGPNAFTRDARAESSAAAVSSADRASILRSLKMVADSRGQVENECSEKVTPQFLSADLGGVVGVAVLLVVEGGPNSVSCYGDGPGLTLMKREAVGWRNIYSSRGGYMAILKTQHGGVHDIAFAGPGFKHPLWTWNGTTFTLSKRTVSDAQTAGAKIFP